MSTQLIINADDLGFSLGINEAVKKAHNEGYLSHASMMTNTDFFQHAVENVLPNCENLKVGLHVNLTCGKSISTNESVDSSFIKLLFLPKTKQNLQKIEKEIEHQLQELLKRGIEISHIDGHEHVHIIPSINKIVRKVAKKYQIKRIREINEDFFTAFKYNFRTTTPSNIVKFLILKTLSFFNKNDNRVKFYTILNTCEINADNLFNFLENENERMVEIMLHPSIVSLDNIDNELSARFLDFMKSTYRTQEYELCFNEKFKNYEIAF